VADTKVNGPKDGALLVTDDEPRKKSSAIPDDQKADEAAEYLDEILELMDMDVEVDIREDGERIVLDVVGDDAGRVIGKKGQTLDALQFLLNKIMNRSPEGRRHIIVDSGDYRTRHDEGLESLALREAKRALDEGCVVTLQPMSARDRRVVHLSLAQFEGVTTASQGHGTGRRIQIIPN
jgi:spoIIIJ-associated protein